MWFFIIFLFSFKHFSTTHHLDHQESFSFSSFIFAAWCYMWWWVKSKKKKVRERRVCFTFLFYSVSFLLHTSKAWKIFLLQLSQLKLYFFTHSSLPFSSLFSFNFSILLKFILHKLGNIRSAAFDLGI